MDRLDCVNRLHRARWLVFAALAAGCSDGGRVAEPVPGWRPPVVTREAGVERVRNVGARERLLIAATPPEAARLLFVRGRATGHLGGGRVAWADAGGGRIVIFDDRGNVAGVLQGVPPGGTPLGRPVAAVAGEGGSVWAVESDGSALRFTGGAPRAWRTSPLVAPAVAGRDGRIAAVRSILEFGLAPVQPRDPLIWILDASGEVVRGVGTVTVPENGILGQLVNAGWVAFGEDGGIYFAAALRPEVRRYDAGGRLRWIGTWTLPEPPPPPRLVAPDGVLEPRFTTLQHGIAPGPDGRLYVLASATADGDPEAVHVFDEDGRWLRTGRVRPDQAIYADGRGAVYAIPAAEALARTGAPARSRFPPFALPALAGEDTLRLADYEGRIVVLNFWASWCGPCRRELPLLDTLARTSDPADVAVIGLNDDVDPDAARAFLRELGVRFPSAEGRGRLRAGFGYRGLPYTVILDRDLTILATVYGFGGDLGPVRRAIASALERAPGSMEDSAPRRPRER